MAKQATYVQDCGSIDFTATAAITVGDIVPVGTGYVGIAQVSMAIGDIGTIVTEGLFDVIAETGVAWTAGDTLYWDATNKKATKTVASNTRMGIAVIDKASATAVGRVALNYC